jgi:GTP-binding protein
MRAYKVWNSRIPTAQLNQWLSAMLISHPPPAPNGRRIKMRYITQAKTRPPGFVVMCSNPEKVPKSYSRYLVNGLREDFNMPGSPIRMTLRSQAEQNPFKNKKRPSQSRLKKHLK